MYTTYLFPFEATAALLIIAVVGAVVLARRPPVGDRVRRPTEPEVDRRHRGRPDPAPGDAEAPGRRAGSADEAPADDREPAG